MNFYDALTVADDKRQPYSITVKSDDAYDDPHGYVDERGYSLTYKGTRYELNVPMVEAFSLEFCFAHNKGFCEGVSEHFGVYFGSTTLDKSRYEVDITYLSEGGTAIALYCVGFRSRELVKEERYSFVQKANRKYKVKITVKDEVVTVKLGKLRFEAPIQLYKGKLGFWRGDGFREIIISNLRFDSNECKSIGSAQKYIVEIPGDNVAYVPYTLEIKKTVYQDNLCRIDYVLDGGMSKKTYGDVVHGNDCCWTGMKDGFTKPFFRVNCGKRIYIDNGTFYVLEEDYTIESENNSVAHEVIGTYNIYRATSKVIRLPLSGSIMTEDVDINEISFGYEHFFSYGSEFYGGQREFVFDRNGKVVYNGEPLETEIAVNVSSPINNELVDQIPSNAYEYDKVVEHFNRNHYFYAHQKPRFTFSVHTAYNSEFLHVKVFLTDAYFKKLARVFPAGETKQDVLFDKNKVTWEFTLDELPQGVYHVAFEVYYCGTLKKEHYSAFEVLDMENDITPQEASGLPIFHIGDGAPAGLAVTCPDPWSILSDFNAEHYVSIACLVPFNFAGRGISELLALTKRKSLVWLTQRSARPEELHNGSCLNLDVVRNADYLNYYWPGVEDSCNYYRYDFFVYNLYTKKMREFVYDFLNQYADPDEVLRNKDVRVSFSPDDLRHFLKKYSTPFMDFVMPILRGMFVKQWEEVKAINPKAKRQSYGPWNAYTSPYVGGYSAKWYGGDPTKWNEMFDGFLQFEDYPYCCGYSTTRSAWGIMTAKYLCPTVRIHPELYDSLDEGCPDGAIPPAHPPLGKCDCPLYVPVTQAYEYIYNSPHMNSDGSFAYWNDYGFMMYSLYKKNPVSSMEAFLKGWGTMLENRPLRPIGGVVFIYDINKADDRYDYENTDQAFYNISDANEAYIYKHVRESGLPVGFVAGFNTLQYINSENCDLLVLPSLKDADADVLAQLMRLHSEGIPMLAVSDVGELNDIFGVNENKQNAIVQELICGEAKEAVAPITTEFRYTADDKDVYLTADERYPVLIKYKNTAVLNAPISQLGVNISCANYHNGPENISELLKNNVRKIVRELVNPLYCVDEQCGITVFENTNGETMLLLIDYSDHNHADVYTRNTSVTIRIGEKNVVDVQLVAGTNKSIGVHKVNGVVDAINVVIKPQESVLLRVIKQADENV